MIIRLFNPIKNAEIAEFTNHSNLTIKKNKNVKFRKVQVIFIN